MKTGTFRALLLIVALCAVAPRHAAGFATCEGLFLTDCHEDTYGNDTTSGDTNHGVVMSSHVRFYPTDGGYGCSSTGAHIDASCTFANYCSITVRVNGGSPLLCNGSCDVNSGPVGSATIEVNISWADLLYSGGLRHTAHSQNYCCGGCDDGVSCTDDSCNFYGGGCTHTPRDSRCNDNNPCTADRCDARGGCQHTPDDSACNDNNPCTTDYCDATLACRHDVITCQAGKLVPPGSTLYNTCRYQTGAPCVNPIGCPTTVKDCRDGTDCSIDYCVEELGGAPACGHTCTTASGFEVCGGCEQCVGTQATGCACR